MALYDMHSHILPDFDDGAESVEDSLALIDSLVKQGVTNICLTPHFYTNERSLEDFVTERNSAFNKFLPEIPEGVNVVLGSEVYVTPFLFNNTNLNDITYGKSRYILTEFSYSSSFKNKTMQQIYMLIENFRVMPVIPHVERYETLMNKPEIIEELKSMGILIQSNIGNYTEKASFFRKRKLLKFISGGLIDILGSDAHSFKHNTPEVFSEAYKTISTKCGSHSANLLMENAERVFNAAIKGESKISRNKFYSDLID
ncbi:MAG: CpsB/CapC family capsule biosynthesis tyrosine phosphatase [Ruminococcus sp.]|nr:CpsB/CapC family capsule biosynthesis tyrosine phosphatase [Ruminococcus sp.]